MTTATHGWDHERVADGLTRARLRSYLAATEGDMPAALALYEWNSEAAGAVLGVVGTAEVMVRNALDGALCVWAERRTGARRWFDIAPLDVRGVDDVARAVRRATRFGTVPEDHGQVIAELPMGFWRYLVGSRYLTSLWVPALASAFPGGATDLRGRRVAVERRLDRLHFVRNRVAHHEPVHRRDLLADLRAAVEVVRWTCPDCAAWLLATSRVRQVVPRRPRAPSG